MQAYSDPKRESDPHALPDVEVFYMSENDINGIGAKDSRFHNEDTGEPLPAGYYYWFCFPGCMPDSDPIGPFDTEEEALADAQQYAEEES